MDHLGGAGRPQRLSPRHDRRVVDGPVPFWIVELPDAVVTVGVPAGAAEQVPIERAAHIGGEAQAVFRGVEGYRVPLVDWLAVNDRLGGFAQIVRMRIRVARPGRLVAVLAHVEVKPRRLVEDLGGAAPARGVEGDEMPAAVALAQAGGHRLDDGAVAFCLDGAVAAEDPHERGVAVASAEPEAVGAGVFRREDFGTLTPGPVPLVAPGRKRPDDEPEPVREADDRVDMRPVAIRPLVGAQRILAREGEPPVGVGCAQSVELAEHDRLDGGETLSGARGQIVARLFEREPVEQLPGGVREVEERATRFVLEKAMVVGDAEFHAENVGNAAPTLYGRPRRGRLTPRRARKASREGRARASSRRPR